MEGISTGEILFRSKKDGLLNKENTGKMFLKFLNENQEYDDDNTTTTLIRERLKSYRRHRRDQASLLSKLFQQSIDEKIRQISSSVSSFPSTFDTHGCLFHQTQQKIVALVCRYYTIMQAEMDALSQRLVDEKTICRKMLSLAQNSLQLEKFAVHLEYETNRNVSLKKLLPTNAQYARCRRAAMENVKPNFFMHHPHTGIAVQSVHKIENHRLLSDFQSKVKHTAGGKIKGLFCVIPAKSLEHVITYGMHQERHPNVFTRGWVSFPVPGLDTAQEMQHDVASAAVAASSPLVFPRIFSRYSTITTNDDNENDNDHNNIHYLALCRVLVANARIEKNRVQSDIECSSHDAVYYSEEEEYELHCADNVLPEFLLTFSFVGGDDSTVQELQNEGPAPIISCDLSSAAHSVPDTSLNLDWVLQPSSALPCAFPMSSMPPSRGLVQGRAGGARAMRRNIASLRSDGIENTTSAKYNNNSSIASRQRQCTWEQIHSNAAEQRSVLRAALNTVFTEFWEKNRSLVRMKADGESLLTSETPPPPLIMMESSEFQEELLELQSELEYERAKTREMERDILRDSSNSFRRRR